MGNVRAKVLILKVLKSHLQKTSGSLADLLAVPLDVRATAPLDHHNLTRATFYVLAGGFRINEFITSVRPRV